MSDSTSFTTSRLLTNEEIDRACNKGATWRPVISSRDRDIAIAEAQRDLSDIENRQVWQEVVDELQALIVNLENQQDQGCKP